MCASVCACVGERGLCVRVCERRDTGNIPRSTDRAGDGVIARWQRDRAREQLAAVRRPTAELELVKLRRLLSRCREARHAHALCEVGVSTEAQECVLVREGV